MAGLVVDASAAVEYLLKTPLGSVVGRALEGSLLSAPEMLDAETLSVLRRLVLHNQIDEARARLALDALLLWPVQRLSHRVLAPLAWRYYRNVSAYDAFYVAAARAQGLPLVTTDERLARASGLDVIVQNLRAAGPTPAP